MLDQNTIAFLSVVISAIGILGTLGGVFLGSKLNSRYMMEADKRKRLEEKIEEMFTIVMQINKWAEELSDDMDVALTDRNLKYDLKASRYNEIKPAVDRITTLVSLYIGQVMDEVGKFLDDFADLRDSYGLLFIASTRQNLDEQEAHSQLAKAGESFHNSYVALLASLEKLVRRCY